LTDLSFLCPLTQAGLIELINFSIADIVPNKNRVFHKNCFTSIYVVFGDFLYTFTFQLQTNLWRMAVILAQPDFLSQVI